jgi:hypothetical protein
VDPDRLANPHTINNGEDIASEHGSSIKEEEEDDDDDSAAAAAADLVAGLGGNKSQKKLSYFLCGCSLA